MNHFRHLQNLNMKVQRKIDSLVRRKVKFTALTFDWYTKTIKILYTPGQYIRHLRKLKDYGVCKNADVRIEHSFEIGGQSFEIKLVSFGDIRRERHTFGENPIGMQYGICLFDYVYLFLLEKTQVKPGTETRPGSANKQKQEL